VTPSGMNPSDWSVFSAAFRCFSEPCTPGGCGGDHDWAIPYHQLPGGLSALLWMYVTDLSPRSTFSKFLPFVIDTGAPVTVIPRRLLDDARAFARKDVAYDVLEGVGGGSITGQMFPAALSVNPRRSECAVLLFPPLDVFVAESSLRHGLLGLDALRQISTTFDPSRVRLRRV
jgi:hypothetical protein